MKELTLFASAYLVVFLLGLQSLNVNAGNYLAAFFISFAIGGCHLVIYRMVPNIDSTTQVFAYLIGGPLAIVNAMYCFRNVFPKLFKSFARKG